ncbi:TPA: hypothetical protein PTV43_002954 [Clostridium botulinum]|nr:hypothetical protein [Clostridium botulinum]
MYNLSVKERYNIITQKYYNIYDTYYSDDYSVDPIKTSGNLSRVLNEFLPDFFMSKPHKENEMESLFESFKLKNFTNLKQNLREKVAANDNIYNMFNAPSLSGANSITRTLSTKLGLFWEDIANLSSNVVSPEIEFGIKLKGVDAILNHNGTFIYAQMKTQKNTLTGSQVGRSTSELSVYKNSLFVACIDNNASWTYGGPIERIVGKPFWDLCNISYERLLHNISELIQEAESLLD